MATEIERKFLIRLPDFNKLPPCRIQEMTQTYLTPHKDDPELERRLRIIRENGQVRYVATEKRTLKGTSAAVRSEDEWEISDTEYADRYLDAATQLEKIRYTFPYRNHTFEIDVYPTHIGGDELEGLAVLEVELTHEEEHIDFPPFLELLRELTGGREYSNKALAKPVK